MLSMSGCHLYLSCCYSFKFQYCLHFQNEMRWKLVSNYLEMMYEQLKKKKKFLECWSEFFNQLYFKEQQISLPIATMGTIKRKYDKWVYERKLKKIERCEKFNEWSKYYVGLSLPYGKTLKSEKYQSIKFWWMFKIFFNRPCSTQEISFFSRNTESSLEQ